MTGGHTKILAGAGAAVGAYALWRYSKLATGDPNLDRLGVRGRALRWGLQLGVPAEGLMITARQEGTAGLNPEIGDTEIERGPSVGILEMLRTTAIAEGYVSADIDADTYAAYADPSHEGLTFEWGARYWAKLYVANGRDLHATLTQFNGSSAYADSGIAWAQTVYPNFKVA
jgi:hypothetical protein